MYIFHVQIYTACVFGQSSTLNVSRCRPRPGTVTLPDNNTYDLDEEEQFYAPPEGELWGQGLVGKAGVVQAIEGHRFVILKLV